MEEFYKKFLILLVLLFNFLFLNAAPVSQYTAKTVAFNFIKNVDGRISSASMISLVYTRENAFYVFGHKSGWVIVSANDAVIPILGYSTEGQFRLPEDECDTLRGNNFWGRMADYENQIKYVVDNNISTTYDISSQWSDLISPAVYKSMMWTTTAVNPLLNTTWDQVWPYNASCPSGAVVGCVGVAMGQILKYHNWPSQGLGEYGYQYGSWPYTSANFGQTNYNFSSMPNSITSMTTAGDSAVARLLYHTPVSCRAMWGSNTGVMVTSNDNPMVTSFVNYFKYAFSTIKYVQAIDYTSNAWDSIIQNELINNRPVYYRGDGSLSHAWVCDGVDISNMYHFNWGWGGNYNGYFALSNLNPGGNTLTNNQAAIIGIKPNDGSTLVVNTTWSGTLTKSTNVAVPDAITLTVNPGANVKFAQNCKLQVWGKISSVGTSTNYAKLTAIDTIVGWDGIDIDEDYLKRMSDNDTSKLIYTQVEWSKSSGIYCSDYNKVIVDHCKVNNNSSGTGAGLSIWFKPIHITNSEIYNNHATIQGGGFFITSTDTLSATISQNNIYDNLSDIDGGGFYFFNVTYIILKNNLFHQNQAIKGAGGALMYGSPSIINNKFCNNITPSPGFGCLYLENCNAKIINNLITNNTANGIFCDNSSPIILNNTISNNTHNFGSGIVFDGTSNASLKNCIIYGNQAYNSSFGNQITIWNTNSDPFFDHCDIEGGLSGFGGPGAGGNYNTTNYTNNIDSNPVFVAPSAGVGSGYNGLTANWQLQSSSPCINTGDTTGVSNLLPVLDLAGNPRINGVIDMGAYEYGGAPLAVSVNISASANNICAGTSVTFTATPSNGGSSPSYQWKKNNVAVGTDSSAYTTTPNNGDSIVCILTSSINGSSGNPASSNLITMIVNAVPAQPSAITGSANPCQNTIQSYSVNNVSGVSYIWAVPSGSVITSGQGTNSVTVTMGSSNGNITVTPSNTCGNGLPQNLAITMNAVPAQPSVITGSANLCQNTIQSYSVNNVSGVSYSWTVPSGSVITSGQGTNSVTVTMGSSNGNITVTPSNTCGNGLTQNLVITMNAVPAQPSAITGSTNPCQNTIQSYSVNNVSGVSYSWTVPSGSVITSGQGTNSVTVTLGSSNGNITVTPSNTCGNGLPQNLAITMNAIPAQASLIIGSDTVCEGSDKIYTINPIAGANTYIWSLPIGATAGGNGNNITVYFNPNTQSGNISVYATNSCGNGGSTAKYITVIPKPSTPVITQTFNTLQSNAASGNQWYNQNTGLINGAVSSTYQPLQNGIYYCIVSLNNCSSDTSNKINVINVGIEEENTGIKVQILPNPNNGSFRVLSSEAIQAITISDMAAKVVYNEEIDNQIQLSISHKLSRGIYLVKLKTKTRELKLKMMVGE